MGPDREIEVRERLTRLWLTAEPAVRAFVAASVRSFQDREDAVNSKKWKELEQKYLKDV